MADVEGPPLWQAAVTITIVLLSLLIMALEWAPADMVMVGTMITFLPLGILTVNEAVAGFSQRGMLTVMTLFVVTAGLERTGAFEPIRRLVIPQRDTDHTPLHMLMLRFVVPVLLISAFLNNTPVVALMIPVVTDLAVKTRISSSKFLIPLSYAAILGGTCTVIGTSTNLVVLALVEKAVESTTGGTFPFGFFEIGKAGLPTALAGVLYMLLFAGPLLPARTSVAESVAHPREYTVTVVVKRISPIVGKTIEDAGLRSVPGLFLSQIYRGDTAIPAPSPTEVIQANDLLLFAGLVDSVVELTRVRGVELAEKRHYDVLHGETDGGVDSTFPSGDELAATDGAEALEEGTRTSVDSHASETAHAGSSAAAGAAEPATPASALPRSMGSQIPFPTPDTVGDGVATNTAEGDGPSGVRRRRRTSAARDWRKLANSYVSILRPTAEARLVEAVVAQRSPLVGHTVRESKFRTIYKAAIVAVHRRGERLQRKIGDIVLQAGDALLMITDPGFVKRFRNESTFALVTELQQYTPIRQRRAPIAIFLALAMLAISIGAREHGADLLITSLYCVGLMLLTRCLTPPEAREAFRVDLFLVIGCAFAVSQAMVNSGAAALLADGLEAVGDAGGLAGMVFLLYLVTAVLTEVITNNAAVALMFPIAFEAHLSNPEAFPLRPLVYALMMAASASFITPTGYQCNFMVYGPGAYRYLDFPRFGVPLQILVMFISCGVILTEPYWYLWALGAAGALLLFFVVARFKPVGWYSPKAFRDQPPAEEVGGAVEMEDLGRAPSVGAVVGAESTISTLVLPQSHEIAHEA